MNKFRCLARRGTLSFSSVLLMFPLLSQAVDAATLTAGSAKLAFGHQTVATTSAPQSVTLTNTGPDAATISAIAVTGSMADDFAQSNNCGTTLAAGGSCKVTVLFMPVSATAKSATLVVNSNASGSPTTVALTGAGVGTPSLTVTPATLNFGHQATGTTSPPKPVTLTNTGTVAIKFSAITVVGSMADDFPQANNCGTSLAVGASCTVNVFLAPVSSTIKTAALTIADNVPGSPQSVALNGAGVPAISFLTNKTSVVFGSIPVGSASPTQTVTITNSTPGAVSFKSITISGPTAADFARTSTCGTSLAGHAACTISLTFKPSAAVVEQDTLSVADASAGSPLSISLTGTGVAQGPTLSGISPTTVATGQAFTLTALGSGFTNTSTIFLAGAAVPTTFVSNGKLTASVSGSLVANPGGAFIAIGASPTTAPTTSGTLLLNVVTPATIATLSPSTITAGSPKFSLSVSGTGLQNYIVVFNGKQVPTSYQAFTNQLIATIDTTLVQNPGTVQVAVQSAFDGSGPLSNTLAFKITPRPPLALTSISPSTVTVGSHDVTLTIQGQGFEPTAVANLNGTPMQTTYLSQVQLLAQVPAGALATVRNIPVTVANSADGTAPSSAISLKVRALTPDATAFQLNSAHTGSIKFGAVSFPNAGSWSVDVGGTPSYAVIAEGKVVITVGDSNNSHLLALDQATGAIVWGPIQLAGPANATYEGGKLFVVGGVTDVSGTMTAYDLSTGKSEWTTQLPGQSTFESGPTAHNGMVFTGGSGSAGTLYALNEGDGSLAWTALVENGDDSTPAVTDLGVYVTYPCQTYAFVPATGATLFRNQDGCEGGGGATPVVANGVLYSPNGIGGFSGNSFDSSSGKLLGSFTADVPAAFSDSMGFFLQSGTLNGITLDNDTIAWSFRGDGALNTSPIVVNGFVLIGSSKGNVYAVDAGTGTQLWSINAGGAIPAGAHWGTRIPLSSLAAGDGMLIVPAGNKVVAYKLSANP